VRRNLILASLLTIAILVSAFVHVWLRGKHAMEASDQALSKGDPRTAITSAKEAAQARMPFSPFPERGKQRLREIAQSGEERADFDTAVIAFRALRAVCSSSAVGRPDACADEADLGLERIAARSGIATAPKEDDTSPPLLLPIFIMLGIIGLVLAANRLRSAKS
jgi:hypothetical protein